jgi:hypothetical protein
MKQLITALREKGYTKLIARLISTKLESVPVLAFVIFEDWNHLLDKYKSKKMETFTPNFDKFASSIEKSPVLFGKRNFIPDLNEELLPNGKIVGSIFVYLYPIYDQVIYKQGESLTPKVAFLRALGEVLNIFKKYKIPNKIRWNFMEKDVQEHNVDIKPEDFKKYKNYPDINTVFDLQMIPEREFQKVEKQAIKERENFKKDKSKVQKEEQKKSERVSSQETEYRKNAYLIEFPQIKFTWGEHKSLPKFFAFYWEPIIEGRKPEWIVPGLDSEPHEGNTLKQAVEHLASELTGKEAEKYGVESVGKPALAKWDKKLALYELEKMSHFFENFEDEEWVSDLIKDLNMLRYKPKSLHPSSLKRVK